MTTITIDISNIDLVALAHSKVMGIPEGQSSEEFVKQLLVTYLMNGVIADEINTVTQIVTEEATAIVMDEITIT